MKVSEFEAKLGTVSDDRLKQMLSASRANGPEVAVKLILAEGRRRGLGGLEGLEAEAAMEEMRAAGSATSAFPQEHAGLGNADAPSAPPAAGPAPEADTPAPTPPDWLAEETKPGMPVAVKVLLLLLLVAAILGVAWKFSR